MRDRAFEKQIEAASAGLPAPDGMRLPPARAKLIRTLRGNARARDFRDRVLTAYRDRCALCDTQLRLTEAAHIVPVKISTSTDETTNGIALCVIHHRAYDAGMVGIAPDYRVTISDAMMRELNVSKLHGGLAAFVGGIRPTLRLPSRRLNYPRPDYLARGMALRGWRGP